jgi:hypothetical protein
MSVSFPTTSSSSAYPDSSTETAVQNKPSTTQQMRQLQASGESAAEIASKLGVPESEVDAALDITDASETTLQQISIKTPGLSVTA